MDAEGIPATGWCSNKPGRGGSPHGGLYSVGFLCHKFCAKLFCGGVPCAVCALCEKLAVLHHREFGKFRRLKGRH